MQTNYDIRSKIYIVGTLALSFVLASCGSYQYAGYEEDAIYDSSTQPVQYVEVAPQTANSQPTNSGYYSDYFKDKSQQYGTVNDDNVIFTDIDSYEGNYAVENDTLQYNEGYGGWGQEYTEPATVNVYNVGGYSGFGWYSPFYASWGWGFGWGWNSGWGYPGYGYGWGWGYPGYGYGWGWNVGGFYPGGYYNPYWNCNYYYSPYYNGYYGRQAVAYNASRRGATTIDSRVASLNRNSRTNYNTARRGTVNNTRGNTSSRARVNNTSRPRGNYNYSRSRVNNNSSRPRVNNSSRTRPRVNSNSSRPRVNNSSRSTRRSNNFNSSRSSRRSNSSGFSRSSSRSNFSGGSRSSGSASRGRSGGSSRRNN